MIAYFRNKLCFQGHIWTRELLLWITRTRPLFSQELSSVVEQVIKTLETKAYQPPSLCWETLSGPEVLASQSSAQDYTVVIRPELAVSVLCNSVLGAGV